ncbi:hypothetical protein GCM10022251_50770 [Phytohabitans flavus]|uniref:Amidohydrolase-related domain-containing protein n=1 Tax=Phytohabitans flavus TaxID=1076124 RepID=A0A6F8XS81_9ACTN|nr:amidohydrolase family protein [Phytohabitans flavus]BCB76649.1 hypothetical protein Pflav_030590 [Phytohabitans flavus]
MIVDAHAHLTVDDPRYPVAPLRGTLDPDVLDDPMTAERLLSMMDDLGVSHAVAVQRAHIFGYDNSYVLDSARRLRPRLAPVCMLDADRPDAAEVAAKLADAGAVAMRFTAGAGTPTGGPPGTAWFAGEHAARVWARAAELGVSLCLHMYRWNRAESLATLGDMMRRFPDVDVVVDHVGSIGVDRPPAFAGTEDLLRLADLSRLHVKVTTLNAMQVRRWGGDPAALVEWLVARFGAGRVLWGSDITQTRLPYPDMVETARASVRTLPPHEADAVLRETALSLYF